MGEEYNDLGIVFSPRVKVGPMYRSSYLAIYILDKNQQSSWCSNCYIGIVVTAGIDSVVNIGI